MQNQRFDLKYWFCFLFVYKTFPTLLHWRNPHFVAVACATVVQVFDVVCGSSKGVPMHIEINSPVKTVQQITSTEYNVTQINSIDERYGKLRKKSKAPTFA